MNLGWAYITVNRKYFESFRMHMKAKNAVKSLYSSGSYVRTNGIMNERSEIDMEIHQD